MSRWLMRSTSWSMIGPSSRSEVTKCAVAPISLTPRAMRLVIGLRALESGQERMMDVDAAPRELGGEAVRQDLHVARENDEIGFRGLDDFPGLSFLLHLGLPGDRQVVKGNVAESRYGRRSRADNWR